MSRTNVRKREEMLDRVVRGYFHGKCGRRKTRRQWMRRVATLGHWSVEMEAIRNAWFQEAFRILAAGGGARWLTS